MAANSADPIPAGAVDTPAPPSIAVRIADGLPWLLLPAGMICKYAERPPLAPVPNVKRWFVGVAVDRGVMTPVFDFARWLDADQATSANAIVVITDRQRTLGFVSVEPPRVVTAAAHVDEDAERALPDAVRDFVGAARLADVGTCFDFLPFDWLRRNAQRVSADA
jgi:chemotaxis signal transduction protein